MATTATVDIAGKVFRDDSPQAGILMVLVQRDTWEQIGLYRSDQSNSDGRVRMEHRAPVPTWRSPWKMDGEPADYDDPGALLELLPIAQPIQVTAEPAQQVSLKVLPAPPKVGFNYSSHKRLDCQSPPASRPSWTEGDTT